MVKVASVDHLKDMGAGDDREQDASGNEIGSHQLPLGCREMMWALPPNGSRLSCGASAGGRKRPATRYRLAGAQTYASSRSRPRRLQALVRHHGSGMDRSRQILRARNSLMSR